MLAFFQKKSLLLLALVLILPEIYAETPCYEAQDSFAQTCAHLNNGVLSRFLNGKPRAYVGIRGHFPKGGGFNELIFSFHPQMGNEDVIRQVKQQKFPAAFDLFDRLILEGGFEGFDVGGLDNSWPKHRHFGLRLSFFHLIESSFYTFNFW